MMKSEQFYILKRRTLALLRGAFHIAMRLFPIDKEKVVFSAYEGDGGFCCNPRYIAEALYKSDNQLNLVWITKDMEKRFPSYLKVVKKSFFNEVFQLSTAKVWVDNYRKPYGTLKRKGQYYIQTWHASIGFKAVGLLRGAAFPTMAKIVSKWDSDRIDYVLSNSGYCDQIYPKKLLYEGPTLRFGSPRCDCLVSDRDRLYAQIRNQYGFNREKKILLYAPTFRGGNQKTKRNVKPNNPTIDFDRLIAELEKRFSGEWIVFLRLHPQLSAHIKEMPLSNMRENMLDVSGADDMSELIAASDVLVTDYSSCAFDAGFAKIPVFLYADDIDDYVLNRGVLVWKEEEIPFSVAYNNDELINNIRQFSVEQYHKKIETFMTAHEIVEDGNASVKAARMIENLMNKKSE